MKRLGLLAFALAFLIALPAQAHTDDELSEWLQSWNQRVVDQGAINGDFIDEYRDMAERHPCRRVIGTFDQSCIRRVVVDHGPASNDPGPSTPGGDTGMGSNVEQWRGLVQAYFGGNTDRALRVMRCESGGNPTARNPSGASGLFQHMARYWPERSSKAGWGGADIFNPEANVAVAAWLSNGGSNWSHWVCKP